MKKKIIALFFAFFAVLFGPSKASAKVYLDVAPAHGCDANEVLCFGVCEPAGDNCAHFNCY